MKISHWQVGRLLHTGWHHSAVREGFFFCCRLVPAACPHFGAASVRQGSLLLKRSINDSHELKLFGQRETSKSSRASNKWPCAMQFLVPSAWRSLNEPWLEQLASAGQLTVIKIMRENLYTVAPFCMILMTHPREQTSIQTAPAPLCSLYRRAWAIIACNLLNHTWFVFKNVWGTEMDALFSPPLPVHLR